MPRSIQESKSKWPLGQAEPLGRNWQWQSACFAWPSSAEELERKSLRRNGPSEARGRHLFVLGESEIPFHRQHGAVPFHDDADLLSDFHFGFGLGNRLANFA